MAELPGSKDPRAEFIAFATRDYELKVRYLTDHFQRLWTRFNYFVVVEAALISGKTIFGANEIGPWGEVFGLGLSLTWYVMGSEDRFQVWAYREQVREAARRLREVAWPEGPKDHPFVGELPDGFSFNNPLEWRWSVFSTTRLASLIPFLVALLWLVLLLQDPGQAAQGAAGGP